MLLAAEDHMKKQSICSWCARMKRGVLYAACRREGCNVLALAQHADDLVESFIMSFMHNGSLQTMKASYTTDSGDLRVIRPLVFVREEECQKFAKAAGLPVIEENCPACFQHPTERYRTKQMLRAQEVFFPDMFSSMLRAIRPLMTADGDGEGGECSAGAGGCT